jgi:hypothetical protein
MDWRAGGREFAGGVSDWERCGTAKNSRGEAEIAEKAKGLNTECIEKNGGHRER